MIVNKISATQILNSVGNPSIKVTVASKKGYFSSSIPQGTSTSSFEFQPEPIKKSIKRINKLKELTISSINDIYRVEKRFEPENINTLGLSMALLKALAKERNKEVYEFLGNKRRPFLLNKIIGGGAHAGNYPEIQEFLVQVKSRNIKQSLDISYTIHKEVGEHLKTKGRDLEGGWAVDMSNEDALDLIELAITKHGFKRKARIGMDVAASSFFKDDEYHYRFEKKDKGEQIDYIKKLAKDYKMKYIEDPLHEDDFTGFLELRKRIPNCFVCGDDLLSTNYQRLEQAHRAGSVDATIVKPNQIGYLYKLKKFVELADKYAYSKIISHRSQETNDNILTDLGVGLGCEGMKIGIYGGERISKLNRLIEIFS